SAHWGASCPRQGNFPAQSGLQRHQRTFFQPVFSGLQAQRRKCSMNDKFTRLRNLESLKKEAKHWFDALRQNFPDARTRLKRALANVPLKPTLRDVQHALAREHGFSGWAELKRRLAAYAEETTKAMDQFQEMADALLEAYCTGTPEAMERHWALTWHRR